MIANSVFSKTEKFMAFKDLWFGLRKLLEECVYSQKFPVKKYQFVALSANLSTKNKNKKNNFDTTSKWRIK